MPIKLHKETVKVSEILCSEYSKQTVENDIIVPDINPDVLKILRVSAKAFITQKSIQQDRAYVQGVIRLNLLYLPEDDLCGKIKSINTSLDFSHFIETPGAKPGMLLCAEAECENVTSDLINSRKLNVSCTVGINIKITSQSEIEVSTGTEDDDSIEMKLRGLKILNSAVDCDREILISEKLDIPSGKPPLCEILKIEADPTSCEIKPLDGKAAVRGELKIPLLYSCETDGGEDTSIEFLEFTLPFTDVVEASGLKEGMDIETDCAAKNINYRIEPGEGGDATCINVEITLCITIKAGEMFEIFALEDIFGTKSNLIPKKNAYTIERFLDNGYIQIPQKELLEVPDYLPGIKRVCDISATPTVTDISVSDGTIIVKGTINTNMLYITHSSDLPVAGTDSDYEFSHSFNMPCICENAVCEAKVVCDHLSYTLSGERVVELRLITALSVKCMSADKTELVDSIEESDEPLDALPEVILYFVQPGDTLWNIAKHFRTSPEKIASDNGIEFSGDEAKIKPGQMLKIIS